MVFSDLVAQAATRAGVTPSEQEIDSRIENISRTAPQILTPYNQDPD